MKFTLNWLREYIDVDLAPSAIADHLTMLGLEVDACEPCYPALSGVHVARIEAVQPHPNADKLVLCDVNIGQETVRVVCGAPNARAGLVTAIAVPGAVLPGNFKIKPAKIRGEKSHGMLCSAKELGISQESAGIMELAADLTPGQPLSEALHLDDTMIEVDLTPNRPDCASVLGIAREIGGVIGKRIAPPVSEPPELPGTNLPFAVEVQAPKDCPRYCARLVRNVTIGPSPWWLQQKLYAVGLRPINNVVDITNFVMLEYGQPLHAFDFNKLAGGKVVVRHAKDGERFTTLDNIERVLEPGMLLICDAERAIALAGVMGGANSEVEKDTTDILLESACFRDISIRRTASRLNMSTDASYRFERGVDPQMAPKAMERAAQLVVSVAGGEIQPGGLDLHEGIVDQPAINLRIGRTSDLLGITLTADQVAKMLTGIEIPVEKIDADTLQVFPPSFRVDLEREIDLVEEVARLYGYNDLPTSQPMVPMSFPEQDKSRTLRKTVADILTAQAFYEAINYSFVSSQHFDMLELASDDELRRTVRLLNPLAEDQSIMRTTLLPGILENVRRNVNHQSGDIRLFEIGKVFQANGNEQPAEPFRLSAVLSGRRAPGAPLLHSGQASCDMFDVKGTLTQIFTQLRIADIAYEKAETVLPYAEKETLLVIKNGANDLGHCGEISSQVLKAFGIKQPVFFIDIDFSLLGTLPTVAKSFTALPKFPSVKWDLALLVPEQEAAGEMITAIKESGEALIEHAEIFDIFRGKSIEAGKKSVAITITYRAADRTLDDETVGAVHQKIIDLLISRFNGQLREA